jgi:hypothetical protein
LFKDWLKRGAIPAVATGIEFRGRETAMSERIFRVFAAQRPPVPPGVTGTATHFILGCDKI